MTRESSSSFVSGISAPLNVHRQNLAWRIPKKKKKNHYQPLNALGLIKKKKKKTVDPLQLTVRWEFRACRTNRQLPFQHLTPVHAYGQGRNQVAKDSWRAGSLHPTVSLGMNGVWSLAPRVIQAKKMEPYRWQQQPLSFPASVSLMFGG